MSRGQSVTMPTPRFHDEYESAHERDVRLAKAEVAHYRTRGADPTRLARDRAEFNRRANIAAARVRALEEAEVDRLAALDSPDYDENDDQPEETTT